MSKHDSEARGITRRGFLSAACAVVGTTAATAAMPAAALAVEQGVIGDWTADGSKNVAVPDSAARPTPAARTARTASTTPRRSLQTTPRPSPPRAVPPRRGTTSATMCVVGAGGGGLNAAARAAELGADVICVEALGLHGGNAQSAGMCGILGGYSGQNKKHFAFPELPLRRAGKLTDWAMDEYHYAADPQLIYQHRRVEGGPCLDWMADCGVQLAPGRGAGVRGAEERHARPPRAEDEGRHRRHVQPSASATGVRLSRSSARPTALVQRRRRGASWAWWRARTSSARCTSTPRGRRHPDGRRLLQQQGAAQGIHPHGGHGLRVELPGGRRDGRVLPHGACGAGADVSGFNSSASVRRRRGLGGRGRPVGALPVRRHDAAVAPAVADRRPLRQPPSLHGQPRGRRTARTPSTPWATWRPSR